MRTLPTRELPLTVDDDGGVWLTSPGVGTVVTHGGTGGWLRAGDVAGQLVVLGRASSLVVPAGAAGFVVEAPPVGHTRVEYGMRLWRLEAAMEGLPGVVAAAASPAGADSGGFLVKAPLAGTFYRSPRPGAAAFVAVGDEVSGATCLCILEAMKVMNPLRLGDIPGAPARARVTQVLIEEAAAVGLGDPLFSLEPL